MHQDQIVVGIDLGENVHRFIHGLGKFFTHGRERLHHLFELTVFVHFGHCRCGEIHYDRPENIPTCIDERQHKKDGHARGTFLLLDGFHIVRYL